MPTLQATIPLNDIKKLMLEETCAFYMCHNVAHLLTPEFEKIFPDFREVAAAENNLIGFDNIAYYYLCNMNTTNLDNQVVGCVQEYMLKIDPSIPENLFDANKAYLYRSLMVQFLQVQNHWHGTPGHLTARQLRIDTLGKILEHFPDAKMPIVIQY